MTPREVDRIVADLERQGADVRRGRRGYVLRLPGGGTTTIHRTTSDQRAVRNQRAAITRAGLRWPGGRA
jgi:hypothetical protein